MLTIHAPHSKWHFEPSIWVRFCQSCAGEFYDMCGWILACPSEFSDFFQLPSVAWDDFARARPAHSMRETVRARGKPLTASDSPILWAGCVRAKIVPCYRWGDQCTVCRAWFKGSCLKIPLFCWKFPFFAIMIPFFGCTRLAALNMDDSFDERSETDISDCSEDISEGEEEDFVELGSDYDHESDTIHSVCSPTNGCWCESSAVQPVAQSIWARDKPVAVKWLNCEIELCANLPREGCKGILPATSYLNHSISIKWVSSQKANRLTDKHYGQCSWILWVDIQIYSLQSCQLVRFCRILYVF